VHCIHNSLPDFSIVLKIRVVNKFSKHSKGFCAGAFSIEKNVRKMTGRLFILKGIIENEAAR